MGQVLSIIIHLEVAGRRGEWLGFKRTGLRRAREWEDGVFGVFECGCEGVAMLQARL